MPQHVVCLSVRDVQVPWSGWNTSKIISRLISLSLKVNALAGPSIGDLFQREHPQIMVE